jgi:hypothetical protein
MERIFAVAIRDEEDLFLWMRIRRAAKGDIYSVIPTGREEDPEFRVALIGQRRAAIRRRPGTLSRGRAPRQTLTVQMRRAHYFLGNFSLQYSSSFANRSGWLVLGTTVAGCFS